MAEISKVYEFLITEFKLNDLVNSVSTVITNNIDNNIKNVYPIVNLDLINTEVESQIIIFNFKIVVLTQRDIIPVVQNSIIIGQDNFIDNLNETHAIASRFITTLEDKSNSYNVELISVSKLDKIQNDYINGLDGFEFDLELSIPKETHIC